MSDVDVKYISTNKVLIIPIVHISAPVILIQDIFQPFVNIQCPPSYNLESMHSQANNVQNFQLRCRACENNQYNILGGQERILGAIITLEEFFLNRRVTRINLLQSLNKTISTEQCKPCPAGGDCGHQIKSRGNFYGFNSSPGTVSFLPCPNKC